jgi:hypothetical protein
MTTLAELMVNMRLSAASIERHCPNAAPHAQRDTRAQRGEDGVERSRIVSGNGGVKDREVGHLAPRRDEAHQHRVGVSLRHEVAHRLGLIGLR